jgi:hypothetical protein
MDKLFHPFTPQGRIVVPGSKSQTIRAYLLASFARGKSTIIGALSSKDALACKHMCEALGAVFFPDGDIMKIDSTQLHPRDGMLLDAENSGTSLYLTTGLAASLGVTCDAYRRQTITKTSGWSLFWMHMFVSEQPSRSITAISLPFPSKARYGEVIVPFPVRPANISRVCCSHVLLPKGRRSSTSLFSPSGHMSD